MINKNGTRIINVNPSECVDFISYTPYCEFLY